MAEMYTPLKAAATPTIKQLYDEVANIGPHAPSLVPRPLFLLPQSLKIGIFHKFCSKHYTCSRNS